MSTSKSGPDYIDIDKIRVVMNPRSQMEDLSPIAGSVTHQGLLQPIRVWRSKDPDDFILDIGGRRLSAMKKSGWTKLRVGHDVIILDGEYNRREHYLHQLAENSSVFRKNVDMVEEGSHFQRLIEEEKMSPEEIAKVSDQPLTRIKKAIAIFERTPEKFRPSIGSGHRSRETSQIPSNVGHRVLTDKNLDDDQKARLLELIRKNSLDFYRVSVILGLVASGAPLQEAFNLSEDYVPKTPVLIMKKDVLAQLKAQHGKTPFNHVIMLALLGRINFPKNAFYIKKKKA